MTIGWHFNNTYSKLSDTFREEIKPVPVNNPELVLLNENLASELNLDFSKIDKKELSKIFSGNSLPNGSNSIAQAYAGHQFGHFTMLGDGRAVLIGEHKTKSNKRYDIQFKGSGKTAFSRNGDGRAALGPMLREYIMSEAMNALKIPTTRSLAVVKTGEDIQREEVLQGAVLTRVASSHIRVGTFQYIAARQKKDELKTLLDYTIDRHYPEIKNSNNQALDLLNLLIEKQCNLVVNWMRVGFIHGVMNTDNMTISGETIDYGPCAFMNSYSPGTVFSSIDQHGRYAYANQPEILVWNLARLAETLIPIVDPDKNRAIELLTETIDCIKPLYESHWLAGMQSKVGLSTEDPQDQKLITDLLSVMEEGQADFTLVFRHLAKFLRGESDPLRNLFKDPGAIDPWLQRWQKRLEQEGVSKDTRAETMDRFNPIYIPRNHKVEEALSAAVEQGDMKPFTKMLNVLNHPFDDIQEEEVYAEPPPISNIPYRTFCGT